MKAHIIEWVAFLEPIAYLITLALTALFPIN